MIVKFYGRFWRAFFAKSGADYIGRPPYRTDDVAKKRIERNRTTDGELWCLFVVREPQDSPRVPPAGRSPTIGGLGERRTGTGALQTDSPRGRNERHWSTADTPLPVPPVDSEVGTLPVLRVRADVVRHDVSLRRRY